jgi:hypothetical protein
MTGWHLIVEGTPEEFCWQRHTKETTGRMFLCNQVDGRGMTVRGTKKPTKFPPGHDEAGIKLGKESAARSSKVAQYARGLCEKPRRLSKRSTDL